ncbi:MAG TPA: carbonic anhydrase family protein [Bryobacteraceae bacterium]|nr:carbonic anhydrase family protein [Bryobacteraceae bacterium]
MKFGCLLAAALLIPATSLAQWKTPWTYDGAAGADRWGALDPDYAVCNIGRQQSPIDIRHAVKADLPALRFDFRSAPLKYLINNGKTIRVNYHDGAGAGSFLIAGDKSYHLTQFHFHHPSEETVNGRSYAMEVHFMLEASDGKAAGVAVFLKAGEPNSTVQKLWEHMPRTEGHEQEIAGVEIDPASLLPWNTTYYMYTGSVTAPPCTEGVTWFVLKTPIEVSAAQIAAFARLYPHDVRPIQPLNDRVVKESQ